MALLDDVKAALRIATDAFDGEVNDLIAAGQARGIVYVKFEEPKKPKGKKGKTAAAEGDKAQQAGATGDDGLADDGQGDDTKGDGAEE